MDIREVRNKAISVSQIAHYHLVKNSLRKFFLSLAMDIIQSAMVIDWSPRMNAKEVWSINLNGGNVLAGNCLLGIRSQ